MNAQAIPEAKFLPFPSSFKSQHMSVHPFLAKSFATPAPSPDPAPVTKATSPFSSFFLYVFFRHKLKHDIENCPLKYLETYLV